jgi:hypothetical protein
MVVVSARPTLHPRALAKASWGTVTMRTPRVLRGVPLNVMSVRRDRHLVQSYLILNHGVARYGGQF